MSKPEVKISEVGPMPPAHAPQAEIPQTRAERQSLLRVIQNYITARKPVPPLSAGELRMHADSIIKVAGVDEKYRKYITVLVNNEVWRETVAGIPYQRRLLLLPKCFRREAACVGTFDQFGLTCKRCGQCAIARLQDEAERLGYAVLVAEGSAVVTAMIEANKLEAIVGVSCLAVLERVFPHMESSGIPGIAIPLLWDGCRETGADMDWVWDAIYLTGDDGNKVRRLDLDGLRDRVDAWFTPDAMKELLGPAATETERIAQEWLARAGKRWRPFLAACAYAAFADNPEGTLPADLARLGMAVECFHKASLVHDDIEDADEVRYGRETLHMEYGVPIALNVGDFLLGEGYRLIGSTAAPPERKAAMFAAAIAGHRNLCLGQGEELAWMRRPAPLSPAQVLGIFRHKTAPAFQVALRLGTLFAGGAEDLTDVLSQYSAFLGIAYQIRDDLDDFDPAKSGGDGKAMRPSLLLAVAYELAQGENRALFEPIWRRTCDLAAAGERVGRAFDALNVRETTAQLLESYKSEAIRALSSLDNANLKGLLRRVIGRIFNDDELRGWCGEFEAEHASGRQPGADSAA